MTLRQPVPGPASATVPHKTQPTPRPPSLCTSTTTDFGLTVAAWIEGHACLRLWKHVTDRLPERRHIPQGPEVPPGS